jgi:hypothetical protein
MLLERMQFDDDEMTETLINISTVVNSSYLTSFETGLYALATIYLGYFEHFTR